MAAATPWFKAFSAHFVAVALSLFVLCIVFTDAIQYYYSAASCFILYLFVAYNTFGLTKRWFLDEWILPKDKAVFITGCDSGFGNQLAKKLDSIGFHVFASCLFPDGEGAEELKQTCSCRLRVLHLDVKRDESVEKAVNFVNQNLGTNELWAVVNNAGVCESFTLEFTTMEHFKETMEVNTFGPIRVTKGFLPLLKRSRGRVINVTSLTARIPVTEIAAYSISKVATLAYTQCLSQEMHLWGVRAISIEPETFRTPITNEKNVARVIAQGVSKASPELLDEYGEEFAEEMNKALTCNIWNVPFMRASYVVVDDMVSAITQKYPYHVYKPRHNIVTRASLWFAENLPYELQEKVLFLKWSIGIPVPKTFKSKSV